MYSPAFEEWMAWLINPLDGETKDEHIARIKEQLSGELEDDV